ncbi:gamma-type small acid-soluble spore protein [Lysinibacillus sp. NPDC096418]|uniref:gamma-type small acid-soluble spore protein n=1 Tax=Lysinibacillus sp. NPDC096418 TaxID=3364138 RepID=UPI0037F597F2
MTNNNNNQYVNQIRQQIQQAEANKSKASGRFATQNAMNEEFGTETDVNQVKQQIQQAEANKIQASGHNANNGFQNNSN